MIKEIDLFQERLNDGIDALKFGDHPVELYEPIKYMLSLGGKRMRPTLVLLAYSLKSDQWEKALEPAMSIELFHNFTLIHDDIMDEAPLRRGEPTVHAKWNRDIAILSGDAMLIHAYDLLLEADFDDIRYLLRLFNKCSVEVCEGQQLDMNFESLEFVSEQEYIEMIRLKTAVLLGFSLELGALLGGMTKTEAERMREFGVNMGIGFQLMDDILDVYGDKQKFGKQVGGDILANKKTFLLIKALELAKGEDSDTLQDWLKRTSFDPEEKVSAVTQLYDNLDIKEITRAKMDQYFRHAFEILDELKLPPRSLEPLKNFAHALIKRDY